MTYTAAQFEADFVGFSSVMAEVQVSRADALTVALSDPALTDVQKYDITKNALASVYYDLAAEAEVRALVQSYVGVELAGADALDRYTAEELSRREMYVPVNKGIELFMG